MDTIASVVIRVGIRDGSNRQGGMDVSLDVSFMLQRMGYINRGRREPEAVSDGAFL